MVAPHRRPEAVPSASQIPGRPGHVLPGELQFPLRSERVDFIEAVKARGRTLVDAEVGQRTISLCHLAYISIQRGGATLRWDPVRERFPDDEAANRLLSGPAPRAPLSLETS